MNELIDNFSIKEVSLLAKKETGDILIQDVKIIAPIPIPKQDIICLGENYVEYEKESAKFKNEDYKSKNSPIYFSKRVNQAVWDGALIQGHSDIVDSLDYEVELAVIIGKEARNIIKEKVYEHIFGYTIINDVSARSLQKKHQQWYFRKSLDGFIPPKYLEKGDVVECEIQGIGCLKNTVE